MVCAVCEKLFRAQQKYVSTLLVLPVSDMPHNLRSAKPKEPQVGHHPVRALSPRRPIALMRLTEFHQRFWCDRAVLQRDDSARESIRRPPHVWLRKHVTSFELRLETRERYESSKR